jgi:murein DD-endopeptidase MepM/ murein hydrolase activator NlpD
MRSDTKKARGRLYNVMIVPEGSARIRRFVVSKRTVKAATALAGFFIALIIVGAVSLIIYRSSYLATEGVRVQAAEFEREKVGLLGRIAELEGALGRVERFASRIETAVNKGSGKGAAGESMVGKGPVENESWQLLPRGSFAGAKGAVAAGGPRWRSPFAGKLTEGLDLELNKMSTRIGAVEEKVHSVFALQKDRLYFWASLPSVWPAKGWITSEFGDGRGWGGSHSRGRIHEGIDIAAPRGTSIVAPGAGIVTFVGYKSGYGNMIIIDHGYGLTTVYGHCQAVYVGEGQPVQRGTIMGAVGNTGRSTGPHLHYEVHVDGVAVNPLLYVMDGV